MALINCSECGNQVSDKASSCPKCGNPIARTTEGAGTSVSVVTDQGNALTVEATGKLHKIVQLIGAALATAGVVSCAAGDPLSASWLIIVGFVVFLAGRISAWWSHG